MIELYEGRLGGGKTYSATVRIVDHVRRGGLIATNIELVWDAIKQYSAERFGVIVEDDQYIALDEEHIGMFHRHTPSGTVELPVLVVLDEAHLTFNARDYAKTDKLYRETLTFLTQSRKVNTDVIFIAQSVLNMDKQFMRLVQYIWRFRDLSKWKIPGLGLRYPFNQILAVQFDYDGYTILQRSFVNKDKRVFALFKTNALLRQFPRLEGRKTQRKLEKTAKRPMMKYLIPLGIVFGLVCAYMLYRNLTSIGKPTEAQREQKNNPALAQRAIPHDEQGNGKIKHDTEAYDIYAEQFVSWNGPERSLKTDGGWYQVGEMSGRGYVTAISSRRAKLSQPDGRIGWVVANKDYHPTPSASIAINQEVKHETVIAKPVPTPSATPDFFKEESMEKQNLRHGPAQFRNQQAPIINVLPSETPTP
jgi:hypothetical protein